MEESLSGIGKTMSDMFINLSAEYPALLQSVLFAFGVVGVFIAASAVFDIIKIGKQSDQMGNSSSGAITGKLVGGVGLVDLSFWVNAWSGTLWANENPLGIDQYVATGGGDYATQAMMAALGFIVIAGYVVLGRAYMGISKLGQLSAESRSNMIGNVLSRITAGSIMVSSLHIAKAIQGSTQLSIL